jgi:hypothetical protein
MDTIELHSAAIGTPEWVARVDASHRAVIHTLVVQHLLATGRFSDTETGQEVIRYAWADLLEAIARYKGFCRRYEIAESIPVSAREVGAQV